MVTDRTLPDDLAYARALTFGAITGLRSMTGLAALVLASQPERPHPFLQEDAAPWSWLSSRGALLAFGAGALGEYVGDKLPITPGRLQAGPLGGRVAFGALAGAASCRAAGVSPAVGAALGALGALGGSAGGYGLRTIIGPRLGLPDLPVALLEDAATIGGAFGLVKGALGK
ncbi:MAG: hypothetical protein AVDCRST_MAG18-2445 [uncultured Thermomicrobiales bacterium]|uniref:Uncharacterized protein n=1 Tax=uncultured Thermomicrobiales bacterium TaxID=1645740 RepID=A0A6J4VEK3_9BACT|nr:MAG: hypothetical protein AVDCRST_MAG18-2445 [uncultured Thermomicrobiales bacterium]